MNELTKVNTAVDYINSIDKDFKAEIAIITGSNTIEYDAVKEIDYKDIPYFPESTLSGYKGTMSLAKINGVNCYILNGRIHVYEGYSPLEVIRPIRVFKGLGVKTIILSNSVGGVNADFESGELMMITDHVNFSGDNPLVGPETLDFGPRFTDMTYAYSPRLQEIIRKTAIALEIPLNEGIFIKFKGPSYETPAEVRIARAVGADVVGMSTVFECIAAVNCGIEVAGISCITHMASGINDCNVTQITERRNDCKLTHEEIIIMCKTQLSKLIQGVVKNL